MLAKIARTLPEGDGVLFEPKWDGFRAIVFRGRGRGLHPEPRAAAAGSLFSGGPRGRARAAARRLRRRRRDRHRHRPRAGLRRAADAAASGGIARREAGEGDAGVVRRVRPAGRRRSGSARRCRRPTGVPGSSSCCSTSTPPVHLTPLTRDRGRRRGMAAAVRRRRPRRRHRQAPTRCLSARQARDVQDQARAHRRLRRRRVPLAQGRRRRWSARCCSASTTTAATLHHVGVTSSFTMVRRRELAEELAPLRENALDEHPWREWAAASGDG